MTGNGGAKYRKVSLDAALCKAIEDMISERPEVAKNLHRFVDDATRRKLEDVYKALPPVSY